MKTFSFIFIVLLVSVYCGAAFAGNRATFLSHGPSVEAYGRGEAVVSDADDISGAYYNPALMNVITDNCAAFSYYILDEGDAYSFAGAGRNMANTGFVGLSAVNLRSGDVEIRDVINSNPKVINTNSWAYLLTYARPIPFFNISAGVNLKYIYLDMYSHTGGSMGADIGLSRSFALPQVFDAETELKCGLSAVNLLQPSITLISQAETYPTTYRAGASWHVPTIMRALDYDTASVYTDLVMEDTALTINAGLEYIFAGKYIARGGMYAEHYTAGLGYHLPILHIDYAMDFAGYTNFNRFSVSYFWGGQATSKAPKRQTTATKILPAKKSVVVSTGTASAVFASSAAITTPVVDDLMAEAKQAMELNKQQQLARDKEIDALYKDAKKDYSKKRYLLATEKFSNLLVNYPECKNAGKYYLRITEKMFGTASAENTSDFEELSYAKGYVAFKQQEFNNALNEWEKVMQANPKRTELDDYIEKVKIYLKDQARSAREREANAKAQSIFDDGVKQFNDNNWVNCIKKMESLQDFCRSQADFSKAADWTNKAGEYIKKAIAELSDSLKRSRKKNKEPQAVELKKPEVELDTEGADKKYKEGLILYAQGKTSDAINMWEIAIRLNPNHEKAKKAISKASEELGR